MQLDFNNIDDINRVMEIYQNFIYSFKFLIFFLYILFGHQLFMLASSFQERFYFIIIFISYITLEIAYFFFTIFLNLIMLIPYLIIYSFPEFIYHCYNNPMISKLPVFFYNLILFLLYIFYGAILNILYIRHYIRGNVDRSGIFIIISNRSLYIFDKFFRVSFLIKNFFPNIFFKKM